MQENYREYRERRKTTAKNTSVKTIYSKKFIKQLLISLICLAAVYSLNSADSDLGKKISTYIKSAINYKVDTEPVTTFFENAVKLTENKTTENGDDTNEKSTQNTAAQDI